MNPNDYFTALERGSDGIWHASGDESVSYPESARQVLFAIEDGSYWFQHRNACIVQLVRKFPARGPILDLGGGNGCVADALNQNGIEAILMEPGPAGAVAARQRGIDTVICATLQQAKARPQSLPAVGMFDVLEHIENDAGFLRQLHDNMQPQGLLYVTVPAFQLLWSQEDILAEHYRRYTRSSLQNLLAQNGFEVLFCSYFFRPLLFAILLFRSLPFRLGYVRERTAIERDHTTSLGVASRLLQKFLTREVAAIGNQKICGFGSSCIAVARCTQRPASTKVSS
jgi:SAM-dependent methyltransferase